MAPVAPPGGLVTGLGWFRSWCLFASPSISIIHSMKTHGGGGRSVRCVPAFWRLVIKTCEGGGADRHLYQPPPPGSVRTAPGPRVSDSQLLSG